MNVPGRSPGNHQSLSHVNVSEEPLSAIALGHTVHTVAALKEDIGLVSPSIYNTIPSERVEIVPLCTIPSKSDNEAKSMSTWL